MGHYCAKCGFDALTPAKSVLIAPPDVAIEHLFPPYSAESNAELKLCLNTQSGLPSALARRRRGHSHYP